MDRYAVYIDEKLYQEVFLEPDKIQVGQRYEVPNQDNPEMAEFVGKKLIVSEIRQGVGGQSTNVYCFRTE